MHKILFLDIDGVLNTFRSFDWHKEPRATIEPPLVANFNRIVEATACKIVLSSSWRYHITSGRMSVGGFETLLRSHGCRGELIGHTREDFDTDEGRWRQIQDWVVENKPSRYVVIDDQSDAGGHHPWVRTNPGTGLTDKDADLAIEILGTE